MCVVPAACETPTGAACTLIGCSDGLTVEVHATSGMRVEVKASAAGDEMRTGTCTVLPSGTCTVRFDDFKPESVSLVVSSEGQPATVTVTPTYEVVQPNGPDCPPACHQATVSVELGGARIRAKTAREACPA
jgi:hypothetical protein